MSEKCHERVWDGWSAHQCSRAAVIDRFGKGYCNQHDPVQVSEKRRKKQEKWDAEWSMKKENWRWEKAAHNLCTRVSAEEMEKLGQGWLEKTIKERQPK
jgi:hypothetical protein